MASTLSECNFSPFIENIGPKLRSRCLPIDDLRGKQPKIKEKSTAVVKYRPISKPKPCDSVQMGEVVLCKMRGFAEWPAVVTGIENNLIHIEFFGDHTKHKATIKSFFKFRDSHDLILANLKSKKTPLYAKSIKEAEMVLGVPPECSIFTKMGE